MNGQWEEQRSARHGAARTLGAYLVAGVLLTMFGRLVWGWVAFGFEFGHADVGDFVQALYDPTVRLHQELLTLHQWSLGVALLVVGLLALLHRKVARGGALLLASIMLVVSLRELAGLVLNEDFRDRYIGSNNLEVHIIGTWLFAVFIAVTIIVMMVRARDLPAPGAPAAVDGAGARLYTVAGAMLLVYGLASLGWLIRNWTHPRFPMGDYLLSLVYAHRTGEVFAGSPDVYAFLYTVALLVLGVLALLRRPVVRGGAMTLAAIFLYQNLWNLYGLTLSERRAPGSDIAGGEGGNGFPTWDFYMKSTEGKLWLLTLVGGTVLVVAIFVCMWRAPERRTGAATPPGAALFVPSPSAPASAPGWQAGSPAGDPPAKRPSDGDAQA